MAAFPPGVYTALVTPFTPDGSSIDWDAYDRLLAEQLEAGITGLVPAGTTGESATLTDEEQRDLARHTVQVAKGRARVVVGTGSNNTKKSVQASRVALEAGADGVLLVTPYYSRPSQEGLFQHVKTIAEQIDAPIMLYNIPARSAVELEVPTLLRLLDACPNVVALKDASGGVRYCQELLQAAKERVLVLSGDDALTLPSMSVGAQGVVSVASNLYPRKVGEVVNLALEGRFSDALALHRRLYPLYRALFSEPSPQPIKAALAAANKMSAAVRSPLIEAGAACRAELAQVVRALEAAS